MIGSKESGMATLMVLALALLLVVDQASAETSGYWSSAASYPISVDDESCVAAGTYVYCVGGFTGDTYTANGSESTGAVYYASVSPSGGIASWSNSTSYPSILNTESCTISGQDIYCIGGYTSKGASDSVYYAGVSSSGISQWTGTTSYPAGVFSQSCSTWDGYIYCIGGYNPSGLPTDSVYYAQASPSGLGAWTSSSSYPVNITSQSCVPSGGYIYCVGGIDDGSSPVTDAVYYAQLSSEGVSTWKQTTSYPTSVDIQSCVVSGDHVYCIGGAPSFAATNSVYYSAISPSGGLGQWYTAPSYPVVVGEQSCVSLSGFIYCIAGAPSASEHTAEVYYALSLALAIGSTEPSMSSSAYSSSATAVNATSGHQKTSQSAAAGALASGLGLGWSYLVPLCLNSVILMLVSLVVSARRKGKVGCLSRGETPIRRCQT